jgi:dienelactone hydrolase
MTRLAIRPARHAQLAYRVLLALAATLAPRGQVVAQRTTAAARDRGPVASIPSYDRAAPLGLRDSLVRTDDALAVHRISFDSPLGGRATGLLLVPSDSLRPASGRFAGLLVLHGAPGNAEGMLSRAEYYARHGAVALILDAPFARRDPRTPISLTSRDSADVVQLAVDLRRAVDVLLARRDVDPARLGFVGVSFGGAQGALLAGIEHRIKAYVLQVADGGMAEHFTNDDGSLAPPFDGVADSTWRRWHAALRPVGSIHYIGSAVPGSILFQWGEQDVMVPPANARRLLAASPAATVKWYESGHRLPMPAQLDALAWLGAKIGLSPATSADGALPAPPPL